MVEAQDLNSLYLKVKEDLNNENHEQLAKSCERILQKENDPNLSQIYITALIKSSQFAKVEQYFQKNLPKSPNDHLLHCYALYKLSKFNELLTYIQANQLTEISHQLLIAQAQFRLEKYYDSYQTMLNLVKKVSKEDYNDLMCNMCACGIKDGKNLFDEFQSKGIYTREFLFNLAIFKENNAGSTLQMFQQMLGDEIKQEDQEDFVMAEIMKDYILSKSYNFNQDLIDKKLNQYVEYSKQKFGDSNLKVVINNNIAALRGFHKNEQYADSIHKIDEALKGKLKQTSEQIQRLKINKLLLCILKNKYTDCQNVIQDIESTTPPEFWKYDLDYKKSKIAYLIHTHNDELLQQELNEISQLYMTEKSNPQQVNFFQNKTFILFCKNVTYNQQLFLLQSEVFKQKNQYNKIIESFIKFSQVDDKIFDSELLCAFIFNILTKNPQLMQNSQQLLEQIRLKTHDVQVLEQIAQAYAQTQQTQKAAEIYEKILQKNPKQSQGFFLRLANLYSMQNPTRSEELLQNLEVPNLITDFNELSKLESELLLSKMKTDKDEKKTTIINKKIKKKKRKIRMPKNFNPQNPGPMPNPERWLPKWERKEFKKKKGMKSRTQGMSNVGQEEKGYFDKGASTANQDVSTQAKKKQNKKKGGRR